MPLRPLARIRCRRIFFSTHRLTIEKTSIRIADPEIIHPSAQDRIDHLDHLPHGLADVVSEDLSELCKQRCPLFQLRRVVRSPYPLTAANTSILKTQKGEALFLR